MTPQTITAAASGTWNLGDLRVNRIGFGAMRITQDGAAFDPDAAPADRDRAIRVLRRAVELGVNHIDTAAFYFSRLRSANELINRALAPYPDGLVIATKVGPGRDPSGAWMHHATPGQLRGQVEQNLRELGRDHLDVVNLRIVGTGSIAERFGALAELREAGLIRHLGLSNVRPHHLAEAQAIAPVVCVQNAFGLGFTPEQQAEQRAFIRLCGEQGVAYVPFYALAGQRREAGLRPADAPAGTPDDGDGTAADSQADAVSAVAQARGVSPAQLRLAWTLHLGDNVLAIPGTGNPEHLAENIAAGALRLSEEELRLLDPAGQDDQDGEDGRTGDRAGLPG
ncbi:aldo/keto reductase [Streptomyces sp. BR123]|uniref:aldo/keto reductase n=1 Tax=Streptomyces sp. BR123 TaxID=2749828 RepID=UPI0015C4577A|nr:aldo/keto reductase [Streptomyces sp. BR123]NXY93531.1 aldo/keto reductase [Streptomyces sp. BR123]